MYFLNDLNSNNYNSYTYSISRSIFIALFCGAAELFDVL